MVVKIATKVLQCGWLGNWNLIEKCLLCTLHPSSRCTGGDRLFALAKGNQHPTIDHTEWMVCGHETLLCWDHLLELTRWLGYVLTTYLHLHTSTYLVVTKCFTYFPTYTVTTTYVPCKLTFWNLHLHRWFLLQPFEIKSQSGEEAKWKLTKPNYWNLGNWVVVHPQPSCIRFPRDGALGGFCQYLTHRVSKSIPSTAQYVALYNEFRWRKVKTCSFGSAQWFWPRIFVQLAKAGKRYSKA